MSLLTILLVLGAALMHASWNALLKSGGDRGRAMTVMTTAAALATLPVLPALPPVPWRLWPLLLGGCALHVGYNLLLVRAYSKGDLGEVYPVARGTSPVGVTVLAALLAGEWPGAPALAGIALVSAGILSLARARMRAAERGGLAVAAATGCFIAAYTVVDGLGGRLSGLPVSYAATLFALDGAAMLVVFFATRGLRARLLDGTRETAKAAAGGVVSLLAYGIVIWAASTSPMGPVSALRETSVVMALLIGRLFLGEPLSARRVASCLAVAAGAVLLGAAAR